MDSIRERDEVVAARDVQMTEVDHEEDSAASTSE
jgi:hypothetical protein